MPLLATPAIAPPGLESVATGPLRSPTAATGGDATGFQSLLEVADRAAQASADPGQLAPAPANEGLPEVTGASPGLEAAQAFYQQAHEGSRALDAMVTEARAGRTFSTQELIGLQARIYRGTLLLETFSKVVESTASGARQLLGTNL